MAAREEIIRVLSSMGFDDDRQQLTIAALSGGWKMKLALGRAMLMKADILVRDLPQRLLLLLPLPRSLLH